MEDSDIQPNQNQPYTEKVVNLSRSSEFSKYMLHSKTEIVAVLRTLIQRAAMVTVHFDQGDSYLLTSVVALSDDNASIIFDAGRDTEMNRKALQAKKLIFTTFVDKVKIQFNLNNLSSYQYEGYPAFIGSVPDILLRLQRREYFRLTIPVTAPVNLNTTVRREDASLFELDIPLWDISGGGVGLLATTDQARFFQIGDELRECKILLPEEMGLTVNLTVRNMLEVTSRSGAHLVRIGCEYLNVPPARLNAIQRYITRIERERKARTHGGV